MRRFSARGHEGTAHPARLGGRSLPLGRAAALLLGAAMGAALSGCPETLDLDTGRFYACARDGGQDQCSVGWRCGLEGYCHPATGAAWLCGGDGDCDGVWRCGTEGVCVNPTADALLPRTWPNPAVELVSPRFVPSKIDVAAASAYASLIDRCNFEYPPGSNRYPFCGEGLDESISFASSGKLVQALRMQETLERLVPDAGGLFVLDDGGVAPRGSATWADLPFTPTSLAVHRLRTFALDPAGRMYEMDATIGGGQSTLSPVPFQAPPPFAPNALKVEHGNFIAPNAPLLVAYERGGTRMAVYSLSDGTSSGTLALPPAITGGAITDVEMWAVPASLILTTNNGLWVANRDSSGFEYKDGGTSLLKPEFQPLPALAKTADGGITTLQAQGYQPIRTWVFDRPSNDDTRYQYILVESVKGSGPNAVHRVTEGGWDYGTPPYDYQLDPPLDAIDCDPGDAVAAVEVHDLFSDEELVVICRQPGGARPDILKRVTGVFGCRLGCEVPQVTPDAGVGTTFITAGYGRSGWSDAHGRLFFDEYGIGQNALTMDRAPSVVVGGKGSLEAWTSSDRLLPFAPTEHFVESGAGLVQALGPEWYAPPSVGGIQGLSAWRIQDANPVPVVTMPANGGQAVVFTLPDLSDLRHGPFQGKARPVNGHPGVVVAAFDTFLSGETGRDRELATRVVPNPRAAISSFDLDVAAPDSGVLLEGYAIAQARLYHVTAETPLRWLAPEVPINVRGEPRAVWLDQGRGRVAFGDGRVFSLPSRVLVAPQLPEINPLASDFGFACGHAFALGRRGLYRLDTSGGGLTGAWTPVDLDAVVAGAAADPGWEGGSLHAVEEPGERSLYVATAHGNVVRISFDPATCP
ncbi:MAG TPA: hypothetical protein VFA20_02485 [Myxococcaceae bacterium]|nr:hypothetical protein [Myxococcaceae bacterium]